VDDYCTFEDRVLLSLDGNVAHGDFIMGFALAVCLDVAQATGMTLLGVGQTVLVTFGVMSQQNAQNVDLRQLSTPFGCSIDCETA
jgi:hypothetical protein